METSDNFRLSDNQSGQADMKSYAINYGLIAGLLVCVYSLVSYFLGQQYNRTLQYVGLIIPIVLLVIAMKGFKKDNMHDLTTGQGFKLGMLFFLVYAIIVVIYTYVFITIIDPTHMDGIREMTRETMEDRGLSDSMIDRQMDASEAFFKLPVMMAMTLASSLFVGAIVSIVTALLLRTPKQH